ncbi:DNA recombination protein RmuC [Microbacterium protaetiae]|uniref:DNA recombination protein RmuC n=1 Tax=Microbacterium protaetiae TaxID=2509458 RepID=A0A4P6EF93_9MICO|nr:DNA recombination protein RmuC [Microbacterium protaetiae]QAY60955.1 DNA recombination protein RmuC [Microbacterium protaetiae]
MDFFWAAVIGIGCLIAGVLAGGALRALRGADERAQLIARAAAAESRAHSLGEQLARQEDLHRGFAEQARADQAARDERERREQSVLRALEPVRETLQEMGHKVDVLERDRHSQYGTLAEQLRRTNEVEEALRSTTESLAGALRSGTTRGVWGETQLRRVVEAAGLIRFVDFDVQTSITSDAGAGRPDMVIRLPGDKALALDAKVPLDAYLEASAIPVTAAGEEAARRATLMGKHVKAVRAHIDALARKTYWAGMTSSPEFVICFLPSESLLAAALDDDPTLLDYAFGKRVALASPVNLWAVLKTVAYTWTQQDVSHEARALFDLGNELYSRLSLLAGHADDLRKAIERTVDTYNRFAGSLETRVLVSARRFPGIDQTKLDALGEASVIEKTTRRLTAPELIDGVPLAPADLGEVRERLEGVSRPE